MVELSVVKQSKKVHRELKAVPIMAFAYQLNPLYFMNSRASMDVKTIHPLIVTPPLKLQLSLLYILG